MTGLPRYDELDRIEKIGISTSWGLLPRALGTLALQSPAAVRDAAHAVHTGEVVSLSSPTDAFDPPLFGRRALHNGVHETGRNIFEDEISVFNPQSASQWDGLPHIRAREFGFYSGITGIDEARAALGIENWAEHGIVGRGILVDVERHLKRLGTPWNPLAEEVLEPETLAEMLAEDGVSLERGDILVLRFGWLAAYRQRAASGADMTDAGTTFAGLASHDGMVRMLWDAGLSAIAADNPAVESAPGNAANGSLHRKLIPGLGFALAELLDLEMLSQRCAERGRTTFLFVAAPSAIAGAVSSTANALAIL